MSKKFTSIFVALITVSVSLHAQSFYRCGNTFQQTPCDSEGSGAITVKEPFSSSNKKNHASDISSGLDDASFNAFYLKGMPAVGMNAQQLIRVLGTPIQVNSKKIRGVAHEQHVYEKEGRRVHVQLKDGVATSIAYRGTDKANKEATRKQAAHSCPTELEIRNAKVAANSLTLSPKERAKRQKAIEKIERCGKAPKSKKTKGK